MATVTLTRPKIRATAQRNQVGEWPWDDILNREIYPALRGLITAVFDSITNIVNISMNRYPPVLLSGASNAITIEHIGKHLVVNHGSATTLTFDAATLGGLVDGDSILILQDGAGQVTLSTSGITVRCAEAQKTREQGSSMMILRISATKISLTGDLELAP